MTEILAKEKQYLRLNEQLDEMTIAATRHEDATGKSIKTDMRCYTYQKAKGQSHPLKKYDAGGDGQAYAIDTNKTFSNLKEQFEEQHANANVNKDTGAGGAGGTRSGGGETYRTSKPSPQSPTNSNRYKYSDTSRSPTNSRTSNRSVLPVSSHQPSTFTVKYRNSKFVESPSLEVLVKDESSSLRCQKSSVNLMAIGDGVHSQDVNTAMAGSKKNISTEGLIKFLKSKIIILEEDHERISEEMKKQKELLEKTLERSKMLEQQRDQAIAKNNTINEQMAKNEKHVEEATKRLKERSMELNTLQKEFEATKRDLKILTQNKNNLEKRLFRANEELASTRSTVTSLKTKERELREAHRLETESKEKQIRCLKKQRADLLNAYKKQLFLIDNLKRQNVCLEQAKMISFAEKEFTKILDWDIKKA